MILLAACRAPDPPPPPRCGSAEGESFALQPHAVVPTLLAATWSVDADQVEVSYRQPDGVEHVTTFDASLGAAVVRGARGDEPVDWVATAVRGDERRHLASGRVCPELPEDVPRWTVVSVDADRSEIARDGIDVLLSYFRPDEWTSWVVVVDAGGGIRWEYASPPESRIVRARVGLDGDSFLWGSFATAGTDGRITRMSIDGEPLSTTEAAELHHDFVEVPGGLAWTSFTFADADIGVGYDVPLATDAIRFAPEGHPEATEVLWDFLADYPVAPWYTCEHMDEGWLLPGKWEWTHSNSIAFDGDTLYVNARHIDGLVAIDWPTRATKWQLGGRDTTLQPASPDLAWSHPHLSEIGHGRLLVMDNAVHTGGDSRVMAITWDEAAGTYDADWIWPTAPEGVSYLGDAKSLPGGNRLIAWGPLPRLTEVTPEGDIVWDVIAGARDEVVVARAEPLVGWRP